MAQQVPGKASFVVCGARFDVDERYRLTKPIGQGAYGVVCSAIDTLTQERIAIKKIPNAFFNLTQTKRTLREIKIMRHFNHSNILGIRDIVKPPAYGEFEDIYIVSDLMKTDLHQIIASGQHLSDEHVQYFVYQLLRGLKYMHSANVLHRDLKPSNLLLNANCDLKICDLGLARAQDNEQLLTEYVATRWYRAPEIMLSWKEYGQGVDVWSAGCVMAEILMGKPLFPGKNYMHQLHLILDVLGSPSMEDSQFIGSEKARAYIHGLPRRPPADWEKIMPNASPLALDLVKRMLQFSPHKRISVEDALAHPFLEALHDPTDEPTCDEIFAFDPDQYEHCKEALKALLWEEVGQHYHPDLTPHDPPAESFRLKSGAPGQRERMDTPMDVLRQEMSGVSAGYGGMTPMGQAAMDIGDAPLAEQKVIRGQLRDQLRGMQS